MFHKSLYNAGTRDDGDTYDYGLIEDVGRNPNDDVATSNVNGGNATQNIEMTETVQNIYYGYFDVNDHLDNTQPPTTNQPLTEQNGRGVAGTVTVIDNLYYE